MSFLAAPLLFAAVALQSDSSIRHQPVACVLAGRQPQIAASLAPSFDLGAAKVYFRGKGNDWYSVAMKAEGAGLSAALPAPLKSISEFHYYVEATSKAMATARTPEITARVVKSAADCKNGLVATTVTVASILVQGPAGAAASIPAGFAPAGVVAGAGGGLSATTIAVVGAAVGGGAIAATQIVGGGTDYLGPINATYTTSFGGCQRTTRFTGTLAITLKGDGGETSSANGRYETLSSTCPNGPQAGNVLNAGFPTGSITRSGNTISGSASETSSTISSVSTFNGTLSGDSITGTFTYAETISGFVGGYSVQVTLTKR